MMSVHRLVIPISFAFGYPMKVTALLIERRSI